MDINYSFYLKPLISSANFLISAYLQSSHSVSFAWDWTTTKIYIFNIINDSLFIKSNMKLSEKNFFPVLLTKYYMIDIIIFCSEDATKQSGFFAFLN